MDAEKDEGTPGARAFRPWTSWSLRLRLTLVAAGLCGAALTLGAILLSSVVSSSRVAALDDVLDDSAVTVAKLAYSDQLPGVLPVTEPGEVAQLLTDDGQVLTTSASGSRTLSVVPEDVFGQLTDDLDGGEALADVAFATTDRSVYAGGLVRVAMIKTSLHGERSWAVTALPLREVEGVVSALRLSLGIVIPGLTLVLGVFMWIVLGRALRPVEALRRGAEQVTKTGGPGTLPVPAAHDELGALARTLNTMLDRLELSAARQRAFVADAAHELRSPVAALRVSIDIARAHPEVYTTRELAGDLESEVLRLQGLVEDLLVLAKVGAAPVARWDVDLRELAEEAVASSAARSAIGADGTLDADGGPRVEIRGAGHATVNRLGVGRVVRNLVDNAVRHATSSVRVTVSDEKIVVEDDGPGLDPADRERVFDRFTRLEEGRQRDSGGTGLGLSIAREVAREHGGDILLSTASLGGLRASVQLRGAEGQDH
jgi:signal transduction histidine kinase